MYDLLHLPCPRKSGGCFHGLSLFVLNSQFHGDLLGACDWGGGCLQEPLLHVGSWWMAELHMRVHLMKNFGEFLVQRMRSEEYFS